MLQDLNVFVIQWHPESNTVLKLCPHQGQVQWHNNFPIFAGHTDFDTGQDAIGRLGHLGTQMAHVHLPVSEYLQVPLCPAEVWSVPQIPKGNAVSPVLPG